MVGNEEKNQAPALAGLLSFVDQTAYDDIDGLKIDYRLLPRKSITTTSHELNAGRKPVRRSTAQFDRETKQLARFQAGEIAKLSASTASKRLEKCLIDAAGRKPVRRSTAQFDRETKQLARFQAGEIAKLSASTASKRLEKCLIDAGVSAVYIPFRGKINFSGNDKAQVEQLPQYAWTGADRGTQDSELIAESLRFVANDGFGKNRVADIIATEFGGNR